MSMGKRLQEALDLRGREPPSLIAALDVSKGMIYNILNDTTKPEKVWAQTALAISSELQISPNWLINGKGSREIGRASQSVGIDPEILSDAMKVLRQTDAITGASEAKTLDPRRIAFVYQLVVEEGGIPAGVIDFSARLAKRLREAEENGTIRREDPGAGGEIGSVKRARTKR